MKKPKLSTLHRKAWKLQSEWIRRSENGVCFTCDRHEDWKSMQAGHYIHGKKMDFMPLNIHCQCPRCNKWLHGSSGIYAERLIAKYGEHPVAQLRESSKNEHKFTISELEELIIKYTNLIAEIK